MIAVYIYIAIGLIYSLCVEYLFTHTKEGISKSLDEMRAMFSANFIRTVVYIFVTVFWPYWLFIHIKGLIVDYIKRKAVNHMLDEVEKSHKKRTGEDLNLPRL